MPGAEVLTAETVAGYVSARSSEIGVFPPDADLAAESIQGGNVNYAFVVRCPSSGDAVFVKQAPEYVAVFGDGPEGIPLTSDRIRGEVAVMREWESVLGDEAERYLPKLYHFDEENKVFVMEFLDGYVLLDHHLVTAPGPRADPDMAERLGEFMARTHLATHSSKVPAKRAEFLTKEYENRVMRDIQLEFVFTKAYKEVSKQTSSKFKVSEPFLREVDALKARYNGESGRGNMALCHGDLHPGSVMARIGDGDDPQVRVIDPEFTIYGPPGVDVGSLLSGYVLAAVHQCYAHGDGAEEARAVVSVTEGVRAAWGRYGAILREGGLAEEYIKETEIESVGYAVAEVCRTALGHAGGRLWLQFEDTEVKEAAVQTALNIVQKCMTARHRRGMGVLLDCLDLLSDPVQQFAGTYSDPNHPGSTRTISLLEGAAVGDYRLAEVVGGGGEGEPGEFLLPAVVMGDRSIVIDFSPKGGPKDFAGVLEEDGGIRFLHDGNCWPRLD